VDLKGYAAILRRRWVVLAACVAVGLLGAGALVATTTKTYRSSARLFVNIPAARSTGEALQGVQLSAQLLQSYANVATSRASSAAVATKLGNRVTAGEVRRAVSADPQPDTLLIDVSARSSDRGLARDLANAAAQQLTLTIADLESGNAGAVQARIIDPAVTSSHPASPRPTKDVAAGLLLGLVVGLALAFVIEGLSSSSSPEETAAPAPVPPAAAPSEDREVVDRLDEALAMLDSVSASLRGVESRLADVEARAAAAPEPARAPRTRKAAGTNGEVAAPRPARRTRS